MHIILQLVVFITVTIDSLWLFVIETLSKTELSALVEHVQVMRGDYRRIHISVCLCACVCLVNVYFFFFFH